MCFALMTAYLEGNLQLQMRGCLLHHGQHASASLRFETSSPIKNTFGGCRRFGTLQTFHHSALTAPSQWHKNLKVHFLSLITGCEQRSSAHRVLCTVPLWRVALCAFSSNHEHKHALSALRCLCKKMSRLLSSTPPDCFLNEH